MMLKKIVSWWVSGLILFAGTSTWGVSDQACTAKREIIILANRQIGTPYAGKFRIAIPGLGVAFDMTTNGYGEAKKVISVNATAHYDRIEFPAVPFSGVAGVDGSPNFHPDPPTHIWYISAPALDIGVKNYEPAITAGAETAKKYVHPDGSTSYPGGTYRATSAPPPLSRTEYYGFIFDDIPDGFLQTQTPKNEVPKNYILPPIIIRITMKDLPRPPVNN